MKRGLILFVLIIVSLSISATTTLVAKAEETQNSTSPEVALSQETHDQIQELDLSNINELMQDVNVNLFPEISATNATTLVNNIVDGKVSISFGSITKSCFTALLNSFQKLLPFICVMLGIILLASLLNKVKAQTLGSQVSQIVYFATFAVLALLVCSLVVVRIVECGGVITKLQNQMQAFFPILLTLMTGAGGSASVRIYQPTVGILSGGVSMVFSSVLLPLVTIMFVLSIVSNLSDETKVGKFQDLISSIFKWTIGIVSTLFMAYLGVNGITASTKDGVSIRAAKYAIKSYVPVLGGYISEGFEVVMASSVLIKNGVGIIAIIILLSTILVPLFSIIVLSVSMRFIAAVVEPVADKKFCSFLTSVAKTLNLLCIVLIGVSLMYFLTISLIISTANNVV